MDFDSKEFEPGDAELVKADLVKDNPAIDASAIIAVSMKRTV
jgi:hypothetical protein